MQEKNYCTFYIVRHGETEWNVQRITQGQKDSRLTQKGEGQAHALRNDFKGIHFDAVFSSDLLRAKRTAEIIALEHKLLVNTSHLLRERSWGKYEGTPWGKENENIWGKMQELSEEEKWKWKFDDDVESSEEVYHRLNTFLREVAMTYPGETILIVSHGGIMRSLLMKLGYDALMAGNVDNGAYIKLKSDGVDFVLEEIKGASKPRGVTIGVKPNRF